MIHPLNNTKGEGIIELILGCMLAGTVMAWTSGCSMTAGESWGTGDRGRILISADAEGMNAFSDLIQGSISNGKASPDQDTAHYQMRREQVRSKALKSWSSFSAGSKPQGAPTSGLQLGKEYEGYAK